jgi:hypothetical protein
VGNFAWVNQKVAVQTGGSMAFTLNLPDSLNDYSIPDDELYEIIIYTQFEATLLNNF